MGRRERSPFYVLVVLATMAGAFAEALFGTSCVFEMTERPGASPVLQGGVSRPHAGSARAGRRASREMSPASARVFDISGPASVSGPAESLLPTVAMRTRGR